MMYGTPVAPEKKVVAMSLNVASTYVKYAEVGDVIDISAYTITLTNEDDTTKTIKANNSMVTSWPDCVDNATHIVISAQTDAKIRISYNSSFYKTITLTTYEYEISGVYYTGNATDLSSVMLYVEYVAKTAEGENLEINGKTLIKKQQLAVSTTPNTPGFVVTSGNDVTSVYINDTIMQYTATRV